MNELYGIAKLAVALWIFNWLKPKLGEFTKEWITWGPLIADCVALVASAALVFFVTGRLLARPRLTVNWLDDRFETLGPVTQLQYLPSLPAIKAYDVQIRMDRMSLFGAGLALACAKFGAKVTASLDPGHAVVFVDEMQSTHPTASCTSDAIAFKLSGSLRTGTLSWINISLQHASGPSVVTLSCDYSVKIWVLPSWMSGLLMPVGSPIKKFEIRS